MAASAGDSTNLQIETAKPWYADYPAPRTSAPSITRETLLSWIKDGKRPGKDLVLVDLRRIDYEGGTIRGSINLPAQSLYHTIPSLYNLFSAAGITEVVWYCGSSGGRGTRAAGWFADYIDKQKDTTLKSLILEGGVKGWAKSGGEYVEWMDGYDATAWQ